jgi:hypothetical protein
MPETPDFPEEPPPADDAAVPTEATPSAHEDEAPEAAHVPESAKEHAPMLDVHPAHHAASTWKDFVIHIATIVLGLLIAVSLEQLVEHIQHLHQVAETREALRMEREDNHLRMAYTAAGFRLEAASLENNLLVLRYAKQHPGTPPENLPGVMTWTYHARPATRSAWMTAQQTGVTALMQREEVASNEVLYGHLAAIDAATDAFHASFNTATRYNQRDPDVTHMTPSQLDDEMLLLEDAMQANHNVGQRLENLRDFAPDFNTISQEELNAMNPAKADADKATLAPAKALTNARLAHTQTAFDEVSKTLAQKTNQK